MVDVREDVLRPPHGTTQQTVLPTELSGHPLSYPGAQNVRNFAKKKKEKKNVVRCYGITAAFFANFIN